MGGQHGGRQAEMIEIGRDLVAGVVAEQHEAAASLWPEELEAGLVGF